MLHVACSGCVVGGDEDGGGHGDDDDGYECASCTDLAASAVYVKSSYLDTLFSGFAPCLCPECSFEGSPADLVRHLTDKSGKHGWAAHKITYGKDHEYAIDAQKSKGKHHELLVAEEDGALFLLVIEFNGDAKKDFVFLVRVTNKAGAVYSSSVAVESPPAVGLTVMVEKKVMASPRRVVDRDYFIPEVIAPGVPQLVLYVTIWSQSCKRQLLSPTTCTQCVNLVPANRSMTSGA
ncbi:uncharacterized protein [Triticum aestivum]|uniref:uncharacterized protein n=1 Tax=Triticum aestivum TaxID=4565 RepID=UPI001D00FFDF|nr:uncharacterized protein LOC123134746 [Triticum aestivum]